MATKVLAVLSFLIIALVLASASENAKGAYEMASLEPIAGGYCVSPADCGHGLHCRCNMNRCECSPSPTLAPENAKGAYEMDNLQIAGTLCNYPGDCGHGRRCTCNKETHRCECPPPTLDTETGI
ncbi:hypothetical protein M5689_000217 [Euphorbia peplus]|nr:hypothetical protein M5689_000217 [Euphorbia peplus]